MPIPIRFSQIFVLLLPFHHADSGHRSCLRHASIPWSSSCLISPPDSRTPRTSSLPGIERIAFLFLRCLINRPDPCLPPTPSSHLGEQSTHPPIHPSIPPRPSQRPRFCQLSSSTFGSVVGRVETDQLIGAWKCPECYFFPAKEKFENHGRHSQEPRWTGPENQSRHAVLLSPSWPPPSTRKTSPSLFPLVVRVNTPAGRRLPVPTLPPWPCRHPRARPAKPMSRHNHQLPCGTCSASTSTKPSRS